MQPAVMVERESEHLPAGAETTGRVCYGLELDPEVRRCDREALAKLHGEQGDA